LLTGVGVDDLTGRDANTLDQLHLCLWGPKGSGEEAPGPAAQEAQGSTDEGQSHSCTWGGP
jgi:hypothetical protein